MPKGADASRSHPLEDQGREQRRGIRRSSDHPDARRRALPFL